MVSAKEVGRVVDGLPLVAKELGKSSDLLNTRDLQTLIPLLAKKALVCTTDLAEATPTVPESKLFARS